MPDLLTSEFAPKRREELQIHNKKIAEISKWLSVCFPDTKDSYPRVLFLTGPSGSGKSTCVEVLCKEMHIEVIDYTPELLHNDFWECEKPGFEQLHRFLVRRHPSLESRCKKQLILVNELPDQVYQDGEKFRESLTSTMYNLHHPVIFCLSNNLSSWNLNPDRLFSQHFISKNGIDVVSLNAVAVTFIRKALVRASGFLRQPLSETKLNVIAEEAKGDLRLAMNMLQLNAAGADSDRRTGTKFVCAATANKEETFHMLGRILYAKRVNPNAPKLNRLTNKRRKSAPIPEPTERTDLEYDASDFIAMLGMTADSLSYLLFENEITFCSDLSKYRRVTDCFSFCDAVTGDWSTRRDLPEVDEYVSQMVTRTIQWNNYKCEKPKCFFSVRRSTLKHLEKQMAPVLEEIKRVPMIGIKNFSAEIAPFTSRINNMMDPRRIECFLTRPMDISWKLEKDDIDDQMERRFQCRKPRKMKRKSVLEVRKAENVKELEEEEKYTIEESSDDSFDEF